MRTALCSFSAASLIAFTASAEDPQLVKKVAQLDPRSHVLAGDVSTTPWSNTTRAALLGVGVSPRYYLIGDFNQGMQLGAVLEPSGVLQLDTGKGVFAVSGGPFVGYKYIAPIGFTLEGPGGLKLNWNETDKQTVVGPLVHLNVGWSF